MGYNGLWSSHAMGIQNGYGIFLLWIDDVSQKLSFDHGTFFNPYHIPILIPILWPWSLHLSLKNIPRSVKSPDLVLGSSTRYPQIQGIFSPNFPHEMTMTIWGPHFQTNPFCMVIIWLLYGYYMVIIWLMMANNNLIGGFEPPTPLKNMMEWVRQLGLWNSQYIRENHPVMFQSPPTSHDISHLASY